MKIFHQKDEVGIYFIFQAESSNEKEVLTKLVGDGKYHMRLRPTKEGMTYTLEFEKNE